MSNVDMQENGKSRLARGNSFFLKGEYESAIKEYHLALSATPNLFLCYENVGWCYEKLNDHYNAQKFYEKTLEFNPLAVRANYFLNKNSLQEKKLSEQKQIFFPDIHKAASVIDKQPLKSEYFDKKLHLKADNFALIRIIGNDLYPRHKIGQSRENVEFILNHEPVLDCCRKIWVVNRIFDKEELNNIVSLLERHNQEYHVIPFYEEEYRAIELDYSCLPDSDYLNSEEFESLSAGLKQRVLVSMLRLKNNYVMNNNGARNYALALGKKMAKWVLPWDGNCFINKASWESIRRGVLDEPYLKHFVVPMARITSNELMLNDDYIPDASEEPQIIFRQDTQEKFNHEYCYGRRPKVELFWRLGIPGTWDTYKDDQWDQPRSPLSLEANQFGIAGWTARLFSGMAEQETQNSKGSANRNAARQTAIVFAIDHIDNVCNVGQSLVAPLELIKQAMGLLPKDENGGIENLLKRFDNGKEFFFSCNRNDGLGERLKAILNVIVMGRLARRKFKIFWPEEVSAGKEFHSIDSANSIFSEDFVRDNFVDKDFFSTKTMCQLSEVNDPKEFYANSSVDGYFCHQNEKFKFFGDAIDLGSDLYKKAFDDIKFSRSINEAIIEAKGIDIGPKAVAIHIRGGDIIYGRYRLSQRYQNKAICFPIVVALIERLTKQGFKVVIFLQDKSIEDELRHEKYKEIVLTRDFSSRFDKTGQAMFDIALMSRCQAIIAGTSGFAEVAARISGIRVNKVSAYIDKLDQLKAIKTWLSGDRKIDNYQHSFALLSYVLTGEGRLSSTEIDDALKAAEVNDPMNGLYSAKRILNFWNDSNYEGANQIAKDHYEKFKGAALSALPMYHALAAETSAGLSMKKYFECLPHFKLEEFKELGLVCVYIKFLMKGEHLNNDCIAFLKDHALEGGSISEHSKYLLNLIG